MPLDELSLYESPAIPPKHDYGIGIIGAGAIVRFAHLPAYHKAGFNVVGIYDKSREAAESAAVEFDASTRYSTTRKLR